MLYVLGAGPGDPRVITLEALETLEKCRVVMGWRSVVERFIDRLGGREVVYLNYENQIEELTRAASLSKEVDVCLLTHGDPSVSDWELLQRLREAGVEYKIVHGVSSALVALGRVGLDLAQVVFVSLHASTPQSVDDVLALANTRALLIFPPPTASGPAEVATELVKRGLGRCAAVVLEDLTLASEKIWRGSVEELSKAGGPFSYMSALVVDCRG
ncbi:MAG: precorrin-6y C5,15-methyltransferase (decarboxylating) subunit CbiE [Thermofilaceae archaeon]